MSEIDKQGCGFFGGGMEIWWIIIIIIIFFCFCGNDRGFGKF